MPYEELEKYLQKFYLTEPHDNLKLKVVNAGREAWEEEIRWLSLPVLNLAKVLSCVCILLLAFLTINFHLYNKFLSESREQDTQKFYILMNFYILFQQNGQELFEPEHLLRNSHPKALTSRKQAPKGKDREKDRPNHYGEPIIRSRFIC